MSKYLYEIYIGRLRELEVVKETASFATVLVEWAGKKHEDRQSKKNKFLTAREAVEDQRQRTQRKIAELKDSLQAYRSTLGEIDSALKLDDERLLERAKKIHFGYLG